MDRTTKLEHSLQSNPVLQRVTSKMEWLETPQAVVTAFLIYFTVFPLNVAMGLIFKLTPPAVMEGVTDFFAVLLILVAAATPVAAFFSFRALEQPRTNLVKVKGAWVLPEHLPQATA